VHCTADAVPQGATLTPLTGSGTSAHTTGSHCIFTWTNTTALAKGGTKTFNYSTDSQSFDEALSVTVSDPTQGSAAPALTVFDDTCNLNHGSLRSPGTSPRQAGLMGGALGFSNQMWVRVPFSLSLDSVAITNKVSVAAWVKPSSLPSGWVSIVSRQFQTSGLEHFGLAFRDGKVTFGINTQEAGTPNKTCSAPTVSPTGTWLHVAGTFDGTTARAYVDGQEVCSFSRPVNLHADTTPLTIGGAYNTPDDVATELFSGLIDDVSVYNRTLTPVEINAISGKPRALLVVRDVVNLGADELLHERLEHLGYMVEPVAANLASTAMATGKAVVVISESGNSGDVGTKFRDVSTPVVNLEVADWKFMNMAGSTTGDTGNVQGQASITILSSAAGHPLAAGLTGGVTATKTGSKLNWAKKLGNGVTKIATLPGDATRVTIFGYEIGSALISGTAAGRRVGMFLSEPATAEMTVATGELFDAAVKWAAAKPALLVVQTNTMVLPSDQKLRERLESLGLPVVVKQDGVGPGVGRQRQAGGGHLRVGEPGGHRGHVHELGGAGRDPGVERLGRHEAGHRRGRHGLRERRRPGQDQHPRRHPPAGGGLLDGTAAGDHDHDEVQLGGQPGRLGCQGRQPGHDGRAQVRHPRLREGVGLGGWNARARPPGSACTCGWTRPSCSTLTAGGCSTPPCCGAPGGSVRTRPPAWASPRAATAQPARTNATRASARPASACPLPASRPPVRWSRSSPA
jgi:hypothetical protein